MKKIIKYTLLIVASGLLFSLGSCDDFLDKSPLDNFTNDNFWTSESNVRTYTWGFYNEFIGYGNGGTSAEFYFQWAGAVPTFSDEYANNTYLEYSPTPAASSTVWRDAYQVIRKANLLLEKLPVVPNLSETSAKHWEGVARFFRAYKYFSLVQRYGNVPYYDQFVNTSTDNSQIYLPPTDRNTVMDKVIEDLTIAADYLLEKDGNNTVNKSVALALLSRAALYEGTYRKYHNLGDGKSSLEAAKSAADKLISSNKFSIGKDAASFKAVYNSEELSGNSEVIFYKEYKTGLFQHSVQAYTNTSTVGAGMTKFGMEGYVTTNGLPIKQVGGNSLYQGDNGLDNTLANRDKRLLETIDSEGYSYRGITKPISRARTSSTGYVMDLYYNSASPNLTTTYANTTDAPILTYGEVLLNYAEACAELGNISQGDLDKSLNILRERAELPPLTYVAADNVQVNGVMINDPQRTSALEQISGAVPSIIWEIRRDRKAELTAWHAIRYYDIMRWHKGEYLDATDNPDVFLGVYLGEIPVDGSGKPEVITLNTDGYLIPAGTRQRKFTTPKHYLSSIPTGQIEVYQKNGGVTLPQNPGW